LPGLLVVLLIAGSIPSVTGKFPVSYEILLIAGSIPSLPCRNMAGNRQLAVAGLLPTAGHAGGWLAYRGHLCNDSQHIPSLLGKPPLGRLSPIFEQKYSVAVVFRPGGRRGFTELKSFSIVLWSPGWLVRSGSMVSLFPTGYIHTGKMS
jgi:hypothetical protein